MTKPRSMRYAGLMDEADRARFWVKVNKNGDGGCWLWTASIVHGYGGTNVNGRSARAHRVAWELLRGPIPDGKQLDHLCRVRHCVNPDHLEPVTNRENALRGAGLAAMHAKQTACKYGHSFTPENTILRPSRKGWTFRKCRECLKRHASDHRKRRQKDVSEAIERAEAAEREVADHVEAIRFLKAEIVRQDADLAALRDELDRLKAERDEARAIVADVNNSVFGSQGYFATPSCVEAVEEVKAVSNRHWNESQATLTTLASVEQEMEAEWQSSFPDHRHGRQLERWITTLASLRKE